MTPSNSSFISVLTKQSPFEDCKWLQMVSDLFSVFEEKYFKANKIESLLHMITTILFVLWSPTSLSSIALAVALALQQ